jgi:capsular polysaccharide biosynthesis protein
MEKNSKLSREQIEQFLVDNGAAVVQLNAIEVLKAPEEDHAHDSPNLITNTILAGMLAAIATYAFFLVQSFIISTITTEEDIKEMIKRPIIGAIPHWEASTPKK